MSFAALRSGRRVRRAGDDGDVALARRTARATGRALACVRGGVGIGIGGGIGGVVASGLVLLATTGCRVEEEPASRPGFVMLVDESPAGHEAEGPNLPSPALWQTPLAEAELERGRQVWTGTCIECHSTGLGGAPLIGNRDMWAPRIAQGLDVLYEHALSGFYGKKGEMPARGGNPSLSDEEVRAAVRFMASRATAAG